ERGTIARPGEWRHRAAEVGDAAHEEHDAAHDHHDTESEADDPNGPRPVRPERPAGRRDKHKKHALDEDPALPARSKRWQLTHPDRLGARRSPEASECCGLSEPHRLDWS